MPDEDDAGRWVVDPPRPGEVSLHMAFGEGVDLTDEQKAAVGELLRTLEARDPEVTGHALDTQCSGKRCRPVKCTGLYCSGLKAVVASQPTDAWNLMGSFNVGIQ